MGERNSCPLRFDPTCLVSALHQIPAAAWSLASSYLDTGVHHGYRRVVLVSAGQRRVYSDLFGFVWDAMSPVWDVTLSRLEPGGFIIPHRDAGPWRERWQVPIVTSGEWRGADVVHPEPGVPFLAKHWQPHAVTNRGSIPRIHLVVDRGVPVDRDPLPFTTYPVPADMADLVERSHR